MDKYRKLRALRDEVEPVLEHCANDPNFCYECEINARDILARHYDKKEPTK